MKKNITKTPNFTAGKELRDITPRQSHAGWKPLADRRDPIDILEESNKDRLPELVPIRYGRMLRNPFTFLRGSSGLMAYDLFTTPNTGLQVQACGDCHLLNFGMYATPERNLIFDINDFDETLPAPWEWDVKRLAASFAVAGRYIKLTDNEIESAVVECVRAYREHLRNYAKQSPLKIWYDHLDAQMIIDMAPDAEARKKRKEFAEKAKQRIGDYLFPKISTKGDGKQILIDQPPLIFHVTHKQNPNFTENVRETLKSYRLSLSDDRRVLLDRYRIEDIAMKVVGIGSVGTRCFIALFVSSENHHLLLQIKEACSSVLEPYAGKSLYKNHGQRIVVGQRLMQSSSDIFLGWARAPKGYYFVRQLRDMTYSVTVEGSSSVQMKRYAEICGWTLARAHAKSGDAALISGYLGKSDTFDQAIGEFALAYADQNEKDYTALVAAVKAGRIKAHIEESK
jgi:uncharacterized protein (DUF2252 family)